MKDTIDDRMDALDNYTDTFDALWFLNVWDEANTTQRSRMTDTTAYNEYYPNLYTQDTTMTHVDSCGVFSWVKYIEENDFGEVPVTIVLGMHHTIDDSDYPGFTATNEPPSNGTFETQANATRAFCTMEYKAEEAASVSNSPDFVCFDYYPFRQVLIDSSQGGDPNTTMCDSSWQFLIEHFEEGLDSTVIAAAESDIPVFYYPQSFGCGAGPRILHWDSEDSLYDYIEYPSYSAYRPPALQEFLLNCNLALLHQCKGIFPYSVRSNWEAWSSDTSLAWNFLSCALLDEELIPFDTPYEDYVYRDRITGNYSQDYVSPDSLPPFDGYDPLYTLPSKPTTTGAKADEDYYEWLFEPYGNLWNSLRSTFASIAWIAPELYDLYWWNGYEDVASIACIDSIPVQSVYYIGPEIKVFGSSSACYLFYVNRYCRVNDVPFEITVHEDSLPSGVVTDYLLSHSERIIIPNTSETRLHTFLDTLDAGEGRLVQFVGSSVSADARLTSPDIYAACGAMISTRDFRFTAEDEIDVHAIVYNMGTSQQTNVRVRLWDATERVKVDSGLVTLPALSTSSRICACDTVKLDWDTDSTDIGVHLMKIEVVDWAGEPDTTDNSVIVPFLIFPRDYATEVRGDPWDMTEATSSPPSWYTDDISDVDGWTSFTDSVSGMFEGSVKSDSLTTNRLDLALDSSTDIDGNLYNQVSLACISPDASCDVIIGWRDTASGSGTVTLYDDLPAGNWVEIGPVDLSGNWSHKTIESLWLRFSYTVNISRPVRIGWVRLEEEGG